MGRGGGRSWVPPGELGGCGASDKSLGLENGNIKICNRELLRWQSGSDAFLLNLTLYDTRLL